MSIHDNIRIEKLQKKNRVAMLKLDCKYGKHEWGPSASPDFEKCQRSFCGAVRKIKDDNSRGKA